MKAYSIGGSPADACTAAAAADIVAEPGGPTGTGEPTAVGDVAAATAAVVAGDDGGGSGSRAETGYGAKRTCSIAAK